MNEKQLTALELMMAQADEVYTNTVGAPTTRKRRADAANVINAMDFLSELDRHNFEESHTIEVGSSRIRRKVAKSTAPDSASTTPQASVEASVDGVKSDQVFSLTIAKPSQDQLNDAFSELFTDPKTDLVVDELEENTKFTKKTADLLEDWLQWEKDQAYLRLTHKEKDARDVRSGTELVSANAPDADFPAIPDFGRRGGGGYGNGRGNGRPGAGNRGSKWKARGKWGALFAAGAALGYTFWPEKSKTLDPDEYHPEGENSPLAQHDGTASAIGAGAWLLGAAKKVPYIGTAVTAGMGTYDAAKVATDDTMTQQEKDRAYTKVAASTGTSMAATTTGAVIGGFIGSIIPVAGTAAGAAFGGMIGGILGDYFGDSIGEYVSSVIHDDTEEAKKKRDDLRDISTTGLTFRGDDPFGSRFAAQMMKQNTLSASQFAGIVAGMGGGHAVGTPSFASPASMNASSVAPKSAQSLVDNIETLPLGAVTAFYESGNRGVGTVSTGKGDAGGVSYGRHQIATNTGTMAAFVSSPENAQYAQRFAGLTPGTPEFNAVYSQIAAEDPTGFSNAQEQFIYRTHVDPMKERLKKAYGTDFSDRGRAVQEYMFTYSNQYGAAGGAKHMKAALEGKDINSMTDEDIIRAMGDHRANNVDAQFKSSSEAVRAGVKNRIGKEVSTMLAIEKREREARLDADPEYRKMSEMLEPVKAGMKAAEVAAHPQDVTSSPEQKVNTVAPEVPEHTVQEVVIQQEAKKRGEEAKQKVEARSEPQRIQTTMTHTLDSIPVYIDDPTINMMNVGYI